MIVEIMQDPVVKKIETINDLMTILEKCKIEYVIAENKDSDDARWVQIPKTSDPEEIALIQDSLKDFFKKHNVTITAFQESFVRHRVEYIRFKILF